MDKKYWRIKPEIYDEDIYEIQRIVNSPNLPPNYETPWWGIIPLSRLKPQPTECEIWINVNNSKKLPDVLWNGGTIEIFSKRILPIFDEFHIQYEVYEPTFIHQKTKQELDIPYVIFRLLEVEEAINYEFSIIKEEIVGGAPFPMIKKLVVKDGVSRHYFRIKGHLYMQIISNSLKKAFEDNCITGWKYYSQDQL